MIENKKVRNAWRIFILINIIPVFITAFTWLDSALSNTSDKINYVNTYFFVLGVEILLIWVYDLGCYIEDRFF